MTTYIKRQKIIKVGNSYAVTLDSDFAKHCQLGKVRDVSVAYDVGNQTAGLVIADCSPEANSTKSAISKAVVSGKVSDEFQHWVENSLSQDKQAMEALKDL